MELLKNFCDTISIEYWGTEKGKQTLSSSSEPSTTTTSTKPSISPSKLG
jgi:hypothetical protein